MFRRSIYSIVFLLFGFCSPAQESLKPLSGNINLIYKEAPAINQYHGKESPPKNITKPISADTLPFFDDFYYASWSPYPNKNWTDSSVYVNTGFAIAPPSIGVATFDGLNKYGYPYNALAMNVVSAAADVLTSKPINLHKFKGSGLYAPSDSLGITFKYQSAGFGDNPEVSDSLILDFFKPYQAVVTGTLVTYGAWVSRVWSSRGVNNPTPNDSTFKRAFIRIQDTAYFHDGFRIRFRNKATTSGSLDHWNLDYIILDKSIYPTDTIVDDCSFGYVPRPFLKNYSAMPHKQYMLSEMAPKFSNFIRNNGAPTTTLNVNYKFDVYDKNNTLLFSYNNGTGATANLDAFKPYGWANDPSLATPTFTNTFPLANEQVHFTIKHYVNTTPNKYKENDTVIQIQNIGSYYAYDDGSAEAGYELKSTNGNAFGTMMALKYNLNTTDTLQAMDVFFDPITNINTIKSFDFRIMVWNDNGGVPGNVVYKDSSMTPVYHDYGYNKIPRFKLTTPLVLGGGTYYFGIKQESPVPMNIGFDRNINRKTNLFYDAIGTWEQSNINGSLMIHPVFGRPQFAVGMKKLLNTITKKELRVYPNPAADVFYIDKGKEEGDYEMEIYSSLGQKVKHAVLQDNVSEVSTIDLAPGIYFVILLQNNTSVSQQKLIISR